METLPADMLLVRCRVQQPGGLFDAAQRFCVQSGLPVRLHRVAWSGDAPWCYVYGRFAAPEALDAGVPSSLARLWTELCPQAEATDVSRLQALQDLPGHSAGALPSRHYVVETDLSAGWEEDADRWYRQEHLPGLAAVPGCVEARRFVNHDHGPRSHACYGLVGEDTLGSPPWLAVRGTEWSSRVRPHFMNTRRTMMRIIGS